MQFFSLLIVPGILAAQTYAVHVECRGKAPDAFREQDFHAGKQSLINIAGSQNPKSVNDHNQTWYAAGNYNWALQIPRGTKKVSNELCDCFDKFETQLKDKRMNVCSCKFGHNRESIIGVERLQGLNKNAKRDHMDGRHKHHLAGVGPVTVNDC